MRIPVSTCRLQFNSTFGFNAAREVLPYLCALGITDIYASPIFRAAAGSTHGYDVADPTRLNPEIGTDADFEALAAQVKNCGLGWVQDIVPNHMVYSHENTMLMDVLEKRERSPFFNLFDINWQHQDRALAGRVLAPFLAKLYGESLENRDLQLVFDAAGLAVSFSGMRFPVKPDSYHRFFTTDLRKLEQALGEQSADFRAFVGAISSLGTLPFQEDFAGREGEINAAKSTLWRLYGQNPRIREFVDNNLARFNGEKGQPASFDLLDTLLEDQYYRLSFWKVADEEINYRRFFNISGLICLNVQHEDVLRRTHSLVLESVEQGRFTGLRVDHIDGLCDPTAYLRRLRETAKDVYLIVEKILAFKEDLPSDWQVEGTTGYDFANRLNGIFCRRESEQDFNRLYARYSKMRESYAELLFGKKEMIATRLMGGEIENLAHLVRNACSRYRYGADITLNGLRKALIEVTSAFPVYRTYVTREGASEQDRACVKAAFQQAVRRRPGLLYELTLLENILLLYFEDCLTERDRDDWAQFVTRFQQFTGPLMAKGFEDTFLYVFNRLLSLNEVGGAPERFGLSVDEFHEFNLRRMQRSPHALNATSTHDTKRGEDARARINVLSELPQEWSQHLRLWTRLNRPHKRPVNGQLAPDRNDEYAFYQVLIGSYPRVDGEHGSFRERLRKYVLKAVREARVHTNWIKPDTDYEAACFSFMDGILQPADGNEFLKSFLAFQKKAAHYGVFNSLSQVLLKIASPGVPDIYRGTELWDFSFVDPDNRRAVDFGIRQAALREIKERERTAMPSLIAELLATRDDGRIKLFLTYRALNCRKQQADIFQQGSYVPLQPQGIRKDHVVAFARNLGGRWIAAVAPRLLTPLIGEGEFPLGQQVWGDTSVPVPQAANGAWYNAITGEQVAGGQALSLGDVLKSFPAALLVKMEEGGR